MSEEIWRWGAGEIASAIRKKDVSCLEVFESCQRRVSQVNPAVNAIVDTMEAEGRAAALEADAALARQEDVGPLHGVPVTIKVNIDVAGRATTNGVAAFSDRIATEDSPLVGKWRDAGAIVVGRTNTPAMSFGLFTNNNLYGRTLNPWNAELSPGGSSGGAAVSVATGMVPLAHGNDSGGSIRYPAYCCGIFGIRPTFGRVAHYSGTSPADLPIMSQLAVVNGPFARSVADLRLALWAMAGHDPRDPWSVHEPVVRGPAPGPSKVAMLADLPGVERDPETVAAVRQAAAWLADAGYQVEEVTPPRFAEASALRDRLLIHEIRQGMLEMIEAHAPPEEINEARALLGAVPPVDFDQFREGLARRTTIIREWLLFMRDYPLVLTPTAWRKPQPVDFYRDPVALTEAMVLELSPLHVPPLLGLPSMAVPTGPVAGVPMGVQLMASQFEEERLLVAAEAIERRVGLLKPMDPVFSAIGDDR
ncbi:amidase [Aquamicrobium soli]|uniref:Indoleacetamide hydrolase n=1 Tax=Aquamicrobium soli TaxID=1811518 RepID=A0ABV7KFX6_9HYPH